jgi:tetratricopeptide (TPR) repeat protein
MRRSEPTRLPAILLAAAFLMASAQSSAQQPTTPTTPAMSAAAAMEKADELYRQGNEAYKQNKLKDAHGFYIEAWKLKKSYDIAGNLGAVELAIGLPRDAAEHLLHSLRQFPANGKPEARSRTKQWLEDALKQIGTLIIKVNVDGADVLVDGKTVGKAPLSDEVFVDAGARKIEARLEGYEPAKQDIQIAKGGTQEVSLKLTKIIAPPPVTGAGSRPARSIPIIVAGAGVAAIALGTGIGSIVVAGSKGSEADSMLAKLKATGGAVPCPAASGCTELKALRSDHDTFHNMAVGFFVVGGLVAGATVAYTFLAAPKPKPSDSAFVRAAPVVSAEGGGLVLTGAF